MRQAKPASSRVDVEQAREFYFAARFTECIDACGSLQTSESQDERSEAALLTARSMLRLAQPLQAEAVLAASTGDHASLDAKLTSSLLVAMARTQNGAPDDALERLRTAASQAQDAHRSIASEIEIAFALAYLAKHDTPKALEHALRVRADSDIIHAAALELQGRCHNRLAKHRDAAASFVAALLKMDVCRQTDRALAASAIAGLSCAAVHLPDEAMIRVAEARYREAAWPPTTSDARHTVEANIASHAVFLGDLKKAAAFALSALTNATSDLRRAASYAQLAGISRRAGDSFIPQTYIGAAWDILLDSNGETIDGHAALELLLSVIEETQAHDAPRARKLLSRFKKHLEMLPNTERSDFLLARERYVEGLIAWAESDLVPAQECFAEAYDVFRQTDSVIHTIESAYALAMLGDDAMYWYAVGALAGITNWMTIGLTHRSSDRASAIELHDQRKSILASLTPSQREVVDLVCANKSNHEIAALRKTAEQTVKNMLTRHIFPAFGVMTRVELKRALSGESPQGFTQGQRANSEGR